MTLPSLIIDVLSREFSYVLLIKGSSRNLEVKRARTTSKVVAKLPLRNRFTAPSSICINSHKYITFPTLDEYRVLERILESDPKAACTNPHL